MGGVDPCLWARLVPEAPPARRQHRKPRPEELPPPVVEARVLAEELEDREPTPVVSLSGYRLRRGRGRLAP
ncbi:hypothetical protein ACGF0D_43035 [Kitasatospora sp. NPDC048298]|uniref:hypothetical protein n=1 Tax=Kitasatospora sp. NPDC048298 TaxID=3364049 RepID=UPI00371864EF